MIQEEFDKIIADADKFCLEHLEEDKDPEAVEALKKAANKVRGVDIFESIPRELDHVDIRFEETEWIA